MAAIKNPEQAAKAIAGMTAANKMVLASTISGVSIEKLAVETAVSTTKGQRDTGKDSVHLFCDGSVLVVHAKGHEAYDDAADLQKSRKWDIATADKKSALTKFAKDRAFFFSFGIN